MINTKSTILFEKRIVGKFLNTVIQNTETLSV
jgi:hypothetical protein